jgi:hypothetical protein
MKPEALDKLIALFGEVSQRMVAPGELLVAPRAADEAPEPVSEVWRRLERGEISTDEFLDIKADKAVERLHGLIPDDDVRHIRALIRDRVETDPVLAGSLDQLVSRSRQR